MSSETVLSPQNAESLVKAVEDMPMLIITGAEDALVSLNSSQAMSSKFVNSVSIVLRFPFSVTNSKSWDLTKLIEVMLHGSGDDKSCCINSHCGSKCLMIVWKIQAVKRHSFPSLLVSQCFYTWRKNLGSIPKILSKRPFSFLVLLEKKH